MSILQLMLPPLAHFEAAPEWRAWLSRGDRLPDAPRGRVAALRELFTLPDKPFPAAALRRQARHGDAGDAVWVCADPAYVRSEANGARLLACGLPDLSVQDADELTRRLRPLFGDAGVSLETGMPSQWNLRLSAGAPLPHFTDPDDALGADMLGCLPAGGNARFWRRLFNEVQIILHAHPLNAARIVQGKQPVNALWFWGAGPLPSFVKSRLALLAGDDDAARGLAGMAGVAIGDATTGSFDTLGGDGAVLYDLESIAAETITREWFPGFQRALRDRRFARIEPAFVSGERFRIKPWHRWRAWRKTS